MIKRKVDNIREKRFTKLRENTSDLNFVTNSTKMKCENMLPAKEILREKNITKNERETSKKNHKILCKTHNCV